MGRRSSRKSLQLGAPLPFETAGLTILPGVPLPEWTQPTFDRQPVEGTAAAGVADAGAAGAGGAAPATAAAVPDSTIPSAPEPYAGIDPAMSAAPMAMAGAMGSATYSPSASTEGYGAAERNVPGHGSARVRAATYPPFGSGAGYGAPQAGSSAGAGTAAGDVPTAGDARGYGAPAGDVGNQPPPARTSPHATTATAPATWQESSFRAGRDEEAPAGGDPATDSAAVAPSQTWATGDRQELSAEHVALLAWWADMIAAGQFPGAPGSASSGASEDRPFTPRRRRAPRGAGPAAPGDDVTAPGTSFPVRTVALGVGVLALVGLAAVTVPRFLAADATPAAASLSTTMPASFGNLVSVVDPEVSGTLEPLLGFGLRPSGITVTGAYGTDAQGPLELAAMATSMAAPADATGQVAAWTQRTGAAVGEPVAGSDNSQGITCAPAKKAEGIPTGTFCVWTGTGLRGQSYAIGMKVPQALELTAQLRSALATDPEAAQVTTSS